jgi:hypothetical protein
MTIPSKAGRALSLAVFALFACAGSSAHAQITNQESAQILLENLNAERTGHGLRPLAVDPALAVAAQRHADLMLQEDMLEHELPGEQGLAQRCQAAGAQFSSIAENIAEGGSLKLIHQSWIESQAHHDNILGPAFTSVGIGVARQGRRIYAVEDFSVAVSVQSPDEVEQRVRDMLAIRGIQPSEDPARARSLCASGGREYHGPGPQPGLVIQFASPDVQKLGPVLDQKIPADVYKTASVGACADSDARGFTRFKLALLLY